MVAQTQNQTRRIQVCVYWDPDVQAYRIYLAEYVRGIGWIDRTYLGSAKNITELIYIMSIFNYVKVCGNDAMRRRDVDAANNCDAVARLVGTC